MYFDTIGYQYPLRSYLGFTVICWSLSQLFSELWTGLPVHHTQTQTTTHAVPPTFRVTSYLIMHGNQSIWRKTSTKTSKVDHITPLLRSLHRFPESQRVHFKIVLLVYECFRLVTAEPSRPLRFSGPGLLSDNQIQTYRCSIQFLCSKHLDQLQQKLQELLKPSVLLTQRLKTPTLKPFYFRSYV